MKRFLKNRKGDEGSPVGLGIGTIFALLVGVVLMIAILASAGLQFGFLQALTGGLKGNVLIAGIGTGGETAIAVLGNIGSAKPVFRVLDNAKISDATYATAIGSFRGRGDEIAVLGSNYRIKTALDSKYTIVDDFGDQYMKDKCKINKMYAADVVGEGKEDLFIVANCEGSIALQLYRITEINDFGSNKATYFAPSIGLVDEGHVAFADFNGDGKQDLAFANFYKQSGIQIIKIFYDFDKTSGNFKESKEIERRPNMRITAMVAGKFTGSERPDILFFTENKELWRIKNLDVTKAPYPGAFRIVDAGFEVNDNEFVTYNQFGVKKYQIVVGNFKGDAKDEIVISSVEVLNSYFVRNSIFLLSKLDADNPEKTEVKIKELTGEVGIPIVSLSAGHFG